MNKKEEFIKLVEELLAKNESVVVNEDAMNYFQALKAGSGKSAAKPIFTENGKKVLAYMQEEKERSQNLFKARDIGEGLFISSRGASGALRKLVTDGYAEKISLDPVVYALTSKGAEVDLQEF